VTWTVRFNVSGEVVISQPVPPSSDVDAGALIFKQKGKVLVGEITV
jgi:hypothetical protein